MTARLVTPRLVVGVPDPGDRVPATLVTDAISAATLIRSGQRVAVLTDAIAVAVLIRLGVDHETARWRVGSHDGLSDDKRLGEDPRLDFDQYMHLLKYMTAILGLSEHEAMDLWKQGQDRTMWWELLHFGDRHHDRVDAAMW